MNNKLNKACSQLLRLFFKSRWFRNLVEVGIDSSNEFMHRPLLVMASLCLTAMSGYTTYRGLTEYMPSFGALLVTLGIQSLLFVGSWRLGGSISAHNFSLSTAAAYIITLCVSVFFSYSALLDHVYPRDRLQADHDSALREGFAATMGPALEASQKVVRERDTGLLDRASKWKDDVDQSFARALEGRREELRKLEARQQGLRQRLETERTMGGSSVDGGITGPGYGRKAREIADMIEQVTVDTGPVRASIVAYDGELGAFREATKTSALEQDAATSIEAGLARCRRLLGVGALVGLHDPCGTGRELVEEALVLRRAHEQLGDAAAECGNGPPAEVGTIERLAHSCVDKLPLLTRDERDRVRRDFTAATIGADPRAHYFERAIGLLGRGHMLALGSLAIALAMDGLVLLCAFLGAKPTSYLRMRRPADLAEIEDHVVMTIFAASAQKEFSPVARMKAVLEKCEVDLELAKKGYGGALSSAALRALGMQKELGTLIALGLADPVENGKRLALRTRLVLWMMDKISASDEAASTRRDVDQLVETLSGVLQ